MASSSPMTAPRCVVHITAVDAGVKELTEGQRITSMSNRTEGQGPQGVDLVISS